MFERTDGAWVGRLLNEDTVVRMPEIDIELPLRELYEDVELVAENEATSAASP